MRASERSPVTLARVTVTRPTPGSRTSVASIWLTSSRTCSAIRSTRCDRAKRTFRTVRTFRTFRTCLYGLCHPLHLEHFDDVANLDVVEVLQADTALEPGLHLGDVVLEAAQGGELAFPHDDAVANQASLGVALSRDAAITDLAAGDGADFRHAECLAHRRTADPHFFERRIQHAGHRLFDLIGHVVDDRMHADV